MKPAKKIWLNGKIVSAADVKGSFYFNQGLNYGASIYEGMRFYRTVRGPGIFRLNDHLDRFFYSARALRMNLAYDKRDLAEAIRKTITANGLRSGYIRPLSFYSEIKMGINILGSKVTTVILAWPWRENEPPKTVRLKIVKYRRLHPDTVDLKAKIAGYYAGGLLGFIEARSGGFDEPLFLDTRGYLAEGAVNNIFIVKNRIIYTPTAKNILGGITRDTLFLIARDIGLRIIEKDMRPGFLKTADEIFLTGTGIELEEVKEIKNFFQRRKTAYPVTAALLKYYQEVSRGKIKKYEKLLTFIR